MSDKFMPNANSYDVSKDQIEEMMRRIENKFVSANSASIDKVKRFSFICPVCGKVDKIDYFSVKDPKEIRCSRCGTPFSKKDYSGFRKAIKKLDLDAIARGGKPLPSRFEEPEAEQEYNDNGYAYDEYGYPQGYENGQGYYDQYPPYQEPYYPQEMPQAAPAQPVNINITNCPLGMLKNGEACDPEKCKAAECANQAEVAAPAPVVAVPVAPVAPAPEAVAPEDPKAAAPVAPTLPTPPPLDYGYNFNDFQREHNFGYFKSRPNRDFGYSEYAPYENYPSDPYAQDYQDPYQQPYQQPYQEPYQEPYPEAYAQKREPQREQQREVITAAPVYDNTPKQQQSVVQPLAIVPYVSQSEPVLQYKPFTLYRFVPFSEEEVEKAIENVRVYNEGPKLEVIEKRDIPAVETKKGKKAKDKKAKK